MNGHRISDHYRENGGCCIERRIFFKRARQRVRQKDGGGKTRKEERTATTIKLGSIARLPLDKYSTESCSAGWSISCCPFHGHPGEASVMFILLMACRCEKKGAIEGLNEWLGRL